MNGCISIKMIPTKKKLLQARLCMMWPTAHRGMPTFKKIVTLGSVSDNIVFSTPNLAENNELINTFSLAKYICKL